MSKEIESVSDEELVQTYEQSLGMKKYFDDVTKELKRRLAEKKIGGYKLSNSLTTRGVSLERQLPKLLEQQYMIIDTHIDRFKEEKFITVGQAVKILKNEFLVPQDVIDEFLKKQSNEIVKDI